MSRINSKMFSSERGDWETPQSFFNLVDKEFKFTLDAAASRTNAKCARFWSISNDALRQRWQGRAWVNPPYGREISLWVRKGYEESQKGAVVVMLIPARTDTSYWHDYVMRAHEVRFLRGRLVFGVGEAGANAPFPSALIVFRPGKVSRPKVTSMERGVLTKRNTNRQEQAT
jgi:phage N-6-adenine-methyltransferase